MAFAFSFSPSLLISLFSSRYQLFKNKKAIRIMGISIYLFPRASATKYHKLSDLNSNSNLLYPGLEAGGLRSRYWPNLLPLQLLRGFCCTPHPWLLVVSWFVTANPHFHIVLCPCGFLCVKIFSL